jgi:hypothetical protein
MKLAVATLLLSVSATPLAAQWLNDPSPGVPRTADGKPNLAAPAPRTTDGKPDLTGIWRMEAGAGVANDLTATLEERGNSAVGPSALPATH